MNAESIKTFRLKPRSSGAISAMTAVEICLLTVLFLGSDRQRMNSRKQCDDEQQAERFCESHLFGCLPHQLQPTAQLNEVSPAFDVSDLNAKIRVNECNNRHPRPASVGSGQGDLIARLS
jgi:hypothetical protein